jgi:release factor glutamine methyltransferase
MTYREALTRATSQLSAHPDLRPSALADAALLLTHTLGISRATLMAHPERVISRDEQAAYQAVLERRLGCEPIQYILGEQEFYGLTLRVTPAVLIPRPETEHLVEAVAARLPLDTPLRIVDVGTGSGAIAIALAHLLPQAHVTALDLSPEALAVARENARTHHLEDRIRFLQSDLLAELACLSGPEDESARSVQTGSPGFDAIVSNPPYIPDAEAAGLHPQVRDHEPTTALFAGLTGLEIYARLIPQARGLLKPDGLLALEIGHGQRDQIVRLLEAWQQVDFLPDIQQIPRVALARRP